jgi:hypothetical protein
MHCEKFVANSCCKKVVVLAPGAADLSEGMACLHQNVCPEIDVPLPMIADVAVRSVSTLTL